MVSCSFVFFFFFYSRRSSPKTSFSFTTHTLSKTLFREKFQMLTKVHIINSSRSGSPKVLPERSTIRLRRPVFLPTLAVNPPSFNVVSEFSVSQFSLMVKRP